MPRSKPSSVKTIRYELGSWERTHLEPVLRAQALDKYSEALGYLLDWKKLYLLITLIEMATGLEILWGTPNDLGSIVEQVRTWWQANKEEYGDDGLLAFINSKMGWGREMSPEEQTRIQAQAEVWANAFGITVDPATGEVGTYTDPDAPVSQADVWAHAFGYHAHD